MLSYNTNMCQILKEYEVITAENEEEYIDIIARTGN
jgi:hypothetical protein